MDNTVYEGFIIFFQNKSGFGFIEWYKDNLRQEDMFLHFSDINMSGFRTVKKGQKVTFSIGLNNKNEPKAVDVNVIG